MPTMMIFDKFTRELLYQTTSDENWEMDEFEEIIDRVLADKGVSYFHVDVEVYV